MGRISHHLKGKDYKKTHQRKLDEQRVLYLERRERQIQELEEAIINKELSAPYKSDWKKDINEGMTTSALLSVTLPATGDVEYLPTESEQNSVSAGPFVSATAVFDTSRYDTMIVDVLVYDEVFAVLDADQNFLFTTFDGSGTYSFRIPQGKNQLFYFAGPDDSEVEPLVFNVTGIRFQRRTPLNVFVGLDDPEATNFIRTDPIMRGLSAQERRKKLEDMLDAGDEYLLKQLGMQGSIARPADTGNIRSWEQAAGDDWSPNSPTRIEFEKEIAYLNSVTDNSFDKMGHYYAPNGMVYPWPPGSSGKTAGLQPGPKYDKQVADELSKAVAAARAEYLKSGQTVAQRQQSYDKLQSAIKAGTDYASSKTQPKLSKTPTSNKSELSDLELYKLGLHRGSDGKVYKLPTNTGKVEYDQMDPLNLAVSAILARLGLRGLTAVQKYVNKGKNQRIPNEDAADLGTLFGDDLAQRGQSDVAHASGQKPSTFGRPDRAVLGIDIPQSIQQGKVVRVPASKGGPGSAPTPLARQIGGRAQKPAMAASMQIKVDMSRPSGRARGSQTSSLASQASSAVGLNPQQKRKMGIKTESTVWDRTKKHLKGA